MALDSGRWRNDKDIGASSAGSRTEESCGEGILCGVKLSSLSHWEGVVVVHENTEVVSEELTAKDGLVVAYDLRVKRSNKKSAHLRSRGRIYVTGKSGEWNDDISCWALFESNLEAELPEGRVG